MGNEIEVAVSSYLGSALLGDRPEAARTVAQLLASGHDPATIIEQVLRPAQEIVGRRWLQARCTVGAEHTATGITDALLSSVTVGFEPPARQGHVVLACADGEWHALPARMAAEELILQGYRVTFLGVALPAEHLARFLDEIDADAVAISCTMASNLPGAARSIHVARLAGYPVLAGGAAFGSSPARAHALGANGWAPGIHPGFDVEALVASAPRLPDLTFLRALESAQDTVVEAGLARIVRLIPEVANAGPAAFARTGEDLELMLRHAIAAFLTDDPTVLGDHLRWMEEMLEARDLPAAWASVRARALAQAMLPHHRGVASLLLATAA